MANCTNCGFQLDPNQPTPEACPRCGAPLGTTPGAPPQFAEGRPDNTLFGLPAAGGPLEDPNFGPPPTSSEPAGPPSVDPGTFGEFDFGAGNNDALQLDTGIGPGSNPVGDGGLDLPAPTTQPPPAPKAPGLGGLDLPAPAGHPPAPPKAPGVAGLDLPTPVASPPPAPKAPGVSGLDLPTPVSTRTPVPKATGVAGLDLPTPAGRAPAPPKAPNDPLAMPGLDLPTPVDLDLPQPATPHLDPNLPQPAGAPADLSIGLDLPRADGNLPTPKSGMDVQPANNLVAPVGLDLEPAGTGLQPAEMGLESRDAGGLAPKEAGVMPAPAYPGAHPSEAQTRQASGPTPRALADAGGSRKVVYGVAALGLFAALGGGLYMAGVFDSEPESQGQRGMATKTPKPDDKDTGKTAPAEAKDRSADVLAQLDADTPAGYAEAAKLAEADGDAVGRAEALLLSHLRYGPDLESAKAGAAAFEAFAGNDAPHVRRVGALIAIINQKFDAASNALAGDDARLAAYRAMVKLAQDQPSDALSEATAASSLALGKALALEAQLGLDPSAGYAALEAALAKDPGHPGLALLLADQALSLGQLRVAETALTGLDSANAPAGFRGRVAALRGQVAAAKGDTAAALAQFDEALEAAPNNPAILEAKVRAAIVGKDFLAATEGMSALKTAAPNDPSVSLLEIEFLVAAGKGDAALVALEQMPKDSKLPELPFLRGEVFAMRMQMEEAKAAFDEAEALSPTFHRSALARAAMLNAARMKVEAIAALDAGVARLREAESAPGPIAEMLTAKARYLIDQGQTKAALSALDQALTDAPAHNDAQVLRGVTRMSTGDTTGGKADLLAVHDRAGAYPGLVAPLGRLFATEGQLDELEALVGERMSSPTASPEVKIVGARLRLAQGTPEDAKALLTDAIAAAPNNWEAQMLMAQAVLDGGDPAEALSRVEAIRTPKPIAELAVLEGKILEHNGKHADARVQYARAVGISPENLEARFLHGRLLAYAGQAKQAISELEYVTERSDAYPRAHLNIGRAQRDLGQNDKALASFAKALELDPTVLEAHYLSGRAQLERNRLSPAVAALEAATAEGAKAEVWYPEAWLFLGRARDKAGRAKEAKAAFKMFLEIAPPSHASRRTVERTLEKL